MAAHRLRWLASGTDSWNTSGVRDPSGAAGRFLGQQTEVRVRWDLLPGNLRLETGAAQLFGGGFIKNAPNAAGPRDVTYFYTQMFLWF